MTKTNGANERIKYVYFDYLKEAQGYDPATIYGVTRSLARFEESTRARDFKRFHKAQAVAFKTRLAASTNARTGERISKATMVSTMRDLRTFFFWLAREPGFKSHIAYSDADYFNMSDKDVAIARARREMPVPTLAQVHHVLSVMPAATVLDRRDRALIAFSGTVKLTRFWFVESSQGLRWNWERENGTYTGQLQTSALSTDQLPRTR